MARWQRNDKTALLSYRDADIYREAGQGGFEIRTFVSLAAAARGQGAIRHFQPIPIFSVSATIGVMEVK
jgi:2,3-dihydroxyphenylpropionate 1,2-dioxygenase